MDISILKKRSGFIPIAMSLVALGVVLVALSVSGIAGRRADEGPVAHVWQLLMAGQLPVIGYFVFVWLRRFPREAAPVLLMQVLAAAGAAAPVYILGL